MRKLLLAAALLAVSSAPGLAFDPWQGEVHAFAYTHCPKDWAPAEGQLLKISEHHALFSLLGNRYGGDARETFALPDLRDAQLASKNGQKVLWCIAIKGFYPQIH